MIHVNETPRHPHAEEFAEIEAGWVDDEPTSFDADEFAVPATENVAKSAESFWLSVLVMAAAVVWACLLAVIGYAVFG